MPWARWLAFAWLAVYVPAYASAYGAWHFLFLCNLGLLLSAAGLIFGQRLLLSSQLLVALPVGLFWIADAASRLLSGHFLHGGTAYMWDPGLPPLVRVLSLYHLGWPLLLLGCVARDGYDRRAFALQCGVTAAVFAVALWLAPEAANINYVVRWPSGDAHAPIVALAMAAVLMLAVYLPLHRALLAWQDRRPVAALVA
ncbi:MAG: hypothetical protein M3Z16_09525 [Pseudomonadota bacterium]|nr:hypothetical protein [Pseudomonadota bacterium]